MSIENFFTGTQNINLAIGPTFAKVAEFSIGNGAARTFRVANNKIKYVFALIIFDENGDVTVDYDVTWENGYFEFSFENAPAQNAFTGVILYSEVSNEELFAEGQ